MIMVKTAFFTVIEKQIAADGTPSTLVTHFTAQAQALSTYYSICASAAVSAIPYHAAHIIRDDGIMIEGRVFDRREEAGPVTGGEE